VRKEIDQNIALSESCFTKVISTVPVAPVKAEKVNEHNISDKIEIEGIQELNSKVIDEVNYKDYVLETAQITLDDVPILTDQHAPVEYLLDPLSSKTYSIEEQATNKISSLDERRPSGRHIFSSNCNCDNYYHSLASIT